MFAVVLAVVVIAASLLAVVIGWGAEVDHGRTVGR